MQLLSKNNLKIRKESGFTLIEVLISLVVLVVGIMGLLSSYNSVNHHQRNSDDNTEATMLASDQLELIKRTATNEPLGGAHGFAYFVDDQNGFLSSYSAPDDFTRTKTEALNGFSRKTTVTIFPPSAQSREDFTQPNTIHMVDVNVEVSWVNNQGHNKKIEIGTALQRRQFVQ